MRRALVLLACLGLAACGSPQHAPAAAPSPQPSSTGAPTARSLSDAEGLDYFEDIQMQPDVSASMSAGRSRGVLSVTPDGLLVAVVNGPVPATPDPGITQSRIQLVDPTGGIVDIPGRDSSRPRQAVYGDSDDHTVVWIETPSTQVGAADWVLLAYDRQSKRTHVVARAAAGDDSSANAPMLAGDRVWWTAVEFTGDEDDPARTNLYSRDLAGDGPIKPELSNVREAVVCNGRLVYTAPLKGVNRQVQVHRRNLATGADTVIATVGLSPEGSLHSLTCSSDDVAWVQHEYDSGTASKVILRHADGTVTTISGGQLSLVVDALTPTFLAFSDGGENGGEWVLDRGHDLILRLSTQPGLAAIVGSGAHVAWRERDAWRVAELF